MKDKKSRRRRYIANLEERRMIARYEDECVELCTRLETEEEKLKREKRREQEQRHKDRYWIK